MCSLFPRNARNPKYSSQQPLVTLVEARRETESQNGMPLSLLNIVEYSYTPPEPLLPWSHGILPSVLAKIVDFVTSTKRIRSKKIRRWHVTITLILRLCYISESAQFLSFLSAISPIQFLPRIKNNINQHHTTLVGTTFFSCPPGPPNDTLLVKVSYPLRVEDATLSTVVLPRWALTYETCEDLF